MCFDLNLQIPRNHFLALIYIAIPWARLVDLAVGDLYAERKKSGPKLDIRLHLGAFILQTVFRWTDRELEENLNFYAPARSFCGLELGRAYDHSAYAKFRNRISANTTKEFNQLILTVATKKGFTNGSILDFDSTVQEANIAYPSDPRMMHKLVNNCKKILGELAKKGSQKAKSILEGFDFKKIGRKFKEYYFAKKSVAGHEKKVELFSYFQRKTKEITEQVALLEPLVTKAKLKWNLKRTFAQITEVAPKLLKQIRHFINNKKVAAKKILALHAREVKCICKGKAGKACEFGRKWFVGRLAGNYAYGFTDDDVGLEDACALETGLQEFEDIFAAPPVSLTGDQGFWSRPNLQACDKKKVTDIGIAPRGHQKWKVSADKIEGLRCRRAKVEPIIGHLKMRGMGKSKMKSDQGTRLEGQRAILSLNISRLAKDIIGKPWKWTG